MSTQSNSASRGSGLCLLSLDSGGARGVSQLAILAQVMHRLKHDSPDDNPDRPRSVFDMISGVGSGGFIAILLVIFGLNAQEALDEFTDLCANVFDKRGVDAETRTVALKQHIDKLLEKHGVDQSTRMLDPVDSSMKYKVAIPISYKRHAGSICILRNYSVRREKTPNLTVSEALLVTLATPPLFTPTQISKDSAAFEYMGADWTLSNPTEEIITEAYEAFGAEERVACVMSLGCGHPGVFVAPNVSDIAAWNEFLENLVTSSERKAQAIDSRMGHLGLYHRFSVSSGLEKTDAMPNLRSGDILIHTQVYLDDASISRKMDACVESLQIRDAISSLEQLQHTGGKATLSPQLPPLTTSFVMRKEPWEFIKRVLLDSKSREDPEQPRMLIVTGIGGCGKTQLVLKFMKEYRAQFKSRFFIDGSSTDRIRADILRNVRSFGTEHSQKSFEDCLLFLSQPLASGMWLLVYDNVDDPDLDLSSLLPRGESCAITITSRNGLLGDLHPEGHLQLDIMSLEEAIQLLLYGNNDRAVSEKARIDVTAIAEALGCLPIALQQARAYMRQTKCSAHAYLERLSKSREKVLRQPIKYQLDSRAISTYAAFETSFSKLPESSKKLLRLLSYFHRSGFPLELVALDAEYDFSEYEEDVVPNADDFYIGKSLLEEIFLVDGEWDDINLDTMMLSLQSYSLVSVTSGVDTLLLQMHPLVHEWVQICIPDSERHVYQSAAVLLLALGAREDLTAATQYLASHVTHMSSLWSHLDLNNAAAFRSILSTNGLYQGAVELQEMIVEEVKSHPDMTGNDISEFLWELASLYYSIGRLEDAKVLGEEVLKLKKETLGERHINTISASNNLALTYWDLGMLNEAEALQKEVLKLRREILGERHSETILALNNISLVYHDLGRLNEAEALQKEVLKLIKETRGEQDRDIISAANNLAITYCDLGRLNEAEELQNNMLKLSKEIQGEHHPDTIEALENLAIIYRDLGKLDEAETLFSRVLKLRKETVGEHRRDTINAYHHLAIIYRETGRLKEAEELQEQVLQDRRVAQGEHHPRTVLASSDLASVLRLQGKLPEAEVLALEVLRLQRELLGDQHHDTLLASYRLAAVHYDQGRFQEAEERLLGTLDSMKNILGSKHHKTTAAMLLLAKVCHSLNKVNDARKLLATAKPIVSETLGTNHPQYFELLKILSSFDALIPVSDAQPLPPILPKTPEASAV